MTLDHLVDDESTLCSHCGANLQGNPIPQKYLDEGYYAEGSTHYSRVIGVEIQGIYDGVLFWACPDCGKTWHRWKLEEMRVKAEPYMKQHEAKYASMVEQVDTPGSKPGAPA